MTKQHFMVAAVSMTLILPAALAKPPKALPKPIIYASQPLLPEDRQHLLTDTFTVVKTVEEIPGPVRKRLILGDKNALTGMANPHDDYQETDVIGPKPLPFRRLILAADSARYSLIYDEHGGIGYYQQASLYRLNKGQATRVWEATISDVPLPLTFDQLRSRLCDWVYRPSEPL